MLTRIFGTVTGGRLNLYVAVDFSPPSLQDPCAGAYRLQCDVIALVDANGSKVVEYKYDAWGKPTSKSGSLANTLGTLNPFRYRGYIFDEETGLYYLRSRYYNPNLCRFINADDVEALGADGDINGYQLFIYCMNDPVNNRDEAGSWSLPNWAKVAIGAALIVGAAVVATVATGGVACFAAGAAIGAAKGAVSGAIGGVVTGAIQSRIETGSWDNALEAAVDGAADGFLGGAIGGFITGGIASKHCFVAGTLIHTEDGLVPIEEIKPDQRVWAEDPTTGERTLKRVVCLFRNEKYELVHLQVNGENITTTVGHPFFVQGKGWVAAKELVVGDKLELLDGGEAYIDAATTEELVDPVKVYNFEVEDFHTYFVGTISILVHNLCKGNHGKEWGSKRRKHWRDRAKNPVENKWYDAFDEDNIARMAKGRAPIGYDGKSVQLHHCKGILNDIDDYIEIGSKAHTRFHQKYGYKNFINIRTVMDEF